MGHRGPSAEEPNGHFSMAEHADEWAEASCIRKDLLEMMSVSLAKCEWAAMTDDERFNTAFKAFRHGNPKEPTHRIYQNALMECGYTTDRRKADAMARFAVANNAKVGDQIHCPGCNTKFEKKTYQHKFCKEKRKGYSNCKDFINNWFNTKRLARTLDWIGDLNQITGPKFGTPKVHDVAGLSAIDAKPEVCTQPQDNSAELTMIRKWLTDGTITEDQLKDILKSQITK